MEPPEHEIEADEDSQHDQTSECIQCGRWIRTPSTAPHCFGCHWMLHMRWIRPREDKREVGDEE